MTTGLLLYVQEYELFDRFADSVEFVYSSLSQTDDEDKKSLKEGADYLLMQVCRAYSLFSYTERKNLLDRCSTWVNNHLLELYAVLQTEAEETEEIKISEIIVNSRWSTKCDVRYFLPLFITMTLTEACSDCKKYLLK